MTIVEIGAKGLTLRAALTHLVRSCAIFSLTLCAVGFTMRRISVSAHIAL